MCPDGTKRNHECLGRERPPFLIQHFLSQHTEVRRDFISISSSLIITCRKWNRLCVSYDFQKNQAQVAFGGTVSQLIVDPETNPNMNGEEEKEFSVLMFQITLFEIFFFSQVDLLKEI